MTLEIKRSEDLRPRLCGCDSLVKTKLLAAIDVVFPEVLLNENKPVLPDKLVFESFMFSLPLVLVSPTKVELLAANSRLIKITEK